MFERSESPSIPKSPRWRPVWLKKSTLSGFIALFFSMFVAVFLVWYFATKKQGLAFTITKNHYAWTYGPTAILVVVVALWKRVNYCVMINQPWIELHNGPSSVEKTILLDYLWPLLPNSFISAIRNRHPAVAITILIFVVLKIIIIISTSLFMPQDSPLSHQIPIIRQVKFDASHFWETLEPGYLYSVSSQPLWDYKSLLNQYSATNIPSHLYYAITNFSTTTTVSHAPGKPPIASAKVEVFQPHVSCDVADLSWSKSMHGEKALVNLTTPSCNIGTVELQLCSEYAEYGYCKSLTEALVFTTLHVNCVNGASSWKFIIDGGHPSYPIAPQQVIVAGKVGLSNETRHNTTGDERPAFSISYDIDFRHIAAVSCSLDYSIQHGMAHGMVPGVNQLEPTTINSGGHETISNLSAPVLHEIVIRALQGAPLTVNFLDTEKFAVPTERSLVYDGALLTLFLQFLSPIDLLNPQRLQAAAIDLLSGLSQQIMRRNFLVSDGEFHDQAIVEYMESRLRVRPTIIWVIGALLSLCTILVFVIIDDTPHGVAPQQANHIVTSARVLFDSPTVLELLRNSTASTRTSDLRGMLAGHRFIAVQERLGSHEIKAIRESPDMADLSVRGEISSTYSSGGPASSKTKRPWMPYSARKHAMALTLLLPGVSIFVLQVLWNFSITNDDFVAVSDDDFATYAVRYGSTGMALLIATLFNSLDFSIATMTPFSTLALGAKGKRTAFFDMIEDLPPVALYKTVRHRNMGAAFSVLASTIGSLLTIITSGLWVQTDVTVSFGATALVESGWNISFTNYGYAYMDEDSPSGTLFDKFQHGFTGDTSPLIWDDRVVFPAMGNPQLLGPQRIPRGASNVQFNVITPAIQPYLQCSIFPTDSAIMPMGQIMVSANLSSPTECVEQTADYQTGYQTSLPTRNWTQYFYGSDDPSNNWYSWERSMYPLRNLTAAHGCPSLAVMFRRWNESPLEADAVLYSVGCTQRLQRVDVNVTYPILPSSSTSPPALSRPDDVTILPKSPVNLVEPSSGISYLMYDIPAAFLRDGFTNSTVEGSGGTPAKDITSPESLVKAMNRLYQKYMVLMLDMNYRTYDLGNTTLPVPDEGIVKGTYNVTFTRLKINWVSKAILQSMLGAMMLLGGLSYWLVDMRVLPRNPYPIASRMAFFCQSERLREYLNSSPKVDDVAEKMFRLGWWDSTDETAAQSSGVSITETFGIDIMNEDKQTSKLLQ